MTKYLLSMDGGGTKTSWLLAASGGTVTDACKTSGCSHPQIGVASVVSHILTNISMLLTRSGLTKSDLGGVCLGIPCFGEFPEADAVISERIRAFLPDVPLLLCNDVEMAFGGALPDRLGIHLVAGTGAMAYGCNPTLDAACQSARSNGWHCLLTDEGSAYWLGRTALAIYFKEADGRLPRHHLYSLFDKRLGVHSAPELIAYYENELQGERHRVAALQTLLAEAARAGDPAALQAYEDAAHELALSALAVKKQLFPTETNLPVTYSGGVFKNGALILAPLQSKLQAQDLTLQKPVLSPEYGGIWMAARACHADTPALLRTLTTQSEAAS